jgi:hypothetical protein
MMKKPILTSSEDSQSQRQTVTLHVNFFSRWKGTYLVSRKEKRISIYRRLEFRIPETERERKIEREKMKHQGSQGKVGTVYIYTK